MDSKASKLDKINKLKAVLNGKLSVAEAFPKFKIIIWEEVKPGYFIADGYGPAPLSYEQIQNIHKGAGELHIEVNEFLPDDSKCPDLADSEKEVIL